MRESARRERVQDVKDEPFAIALTVLDVAVFDRGIVVGHEELLKELNR